MNVETPRRNLTGAMVPALAVAALAGLGALMLVGGQNGGQKAASAAPIDCIIENADGLGGPIDLVDGNGARVTQADFAGAPAAVYFGFAHCPDICPTTMYTLAEALALPGGYDLQPILITVDPARDTPDVMRAYASTDGFPPGLVGLSGAPNQIEAAQRAFQVYARQVPIEGAPDGAYTMDHSSFLYVMDENWRTRVAVPTMRRQNPADPTSPLAATPPEVIAACIAAGLEREPPPGFP